MSSLVDVSRRSLGHSRSVSTENLIHKPLKQVQWEEKSRGARTEQSLLNFIKEKRAFG
jgi:hypothetical protein